MKFDETAVILLSTGKSLPFNVLTPEVETNSKSNFEVN